MILKVDDSIKLELVSSKHVQPIFDIANDNREHLRQWLPWIDSMHGVSFIRDFISISEQRHAMGTDYAFVILCDEMVVGRIGIYKVDTYNHVGELGYWIGKEHEGNGIITSSCRRLLQYGFEVLMLNRIEIRCGVENVRSQRVPERLGFTKEGTLRQVENIRGHFIDHYLYSLLRDEYKST